MKIDKKKLVFAAVLVCTLTFIVAYSLLVFSDDTTAADENIPRTQVPELEDNSKDYDSRMHAVNDLNEKKPSLAPSLYDEIEEEQEARSATYEPYQDSLDNPGGWTMESWSYNRESIADSTGKPTTESQEIFSDAIAKPEAHKSPEEMALVQESFFSHTQVKGVLATGKTDSLITVFVDGAQVVRANSRLSMRLSQPAWIDGHYRPRLTPVYGFVSFGANRLMVNIIQVMHSPVSLKAYDLQDGSEGIYVENNFRAEVSRELLDDALGEVSVPGIPQVGGITRLFQKQNRNIKVSVSDRYQLLLKQKP